MSAVSSYSDEWHLKNVPEDTKRKVRVFAASHGLELGPALTQLVDQALQATPANDTGNHKQSGTHINVHLPAKPGRISTGDPIE